MSWGFRWRETKGDEGQERGRSVDLGARVLDDLPPANDVVRISLPNCSGVPPSTSAPWPSSFFLTSASCKALLKATLSLVTTSFGMEAGPAMPNQVTASKPLKPDSATVGVGQVIDALVRCDRDRAHLAAANVADQGRHRRHVELDLAADQVGRTLSRSLVGHVGELHARDLLELFDGQVGDRAAARACVVDRSGLALPAAMTSASVLYGEEAGTTRTSGALATRPTGARSFCGL